MKKSIILSGLLLFLASCESHIVVDMIVLDDSTGQPLDSVYVNIESGLEDYKGSGFDGYTDSTGRFDCSFMEGMGYRNRTTISKEGYKTVKLKNNDFRDTIYLVQE